MAKNHRPVESPKTAAPPSPQQSSPTGNGEGAEPAQLEPNSAPDTAKETQPEAPPPTEDFGPNRSDGPDLPEEGEDDGADPEEEPVAPPTETGDDDLPPLTADAVKKMTPEQLFQITGKMWAQLKNAPTLMLWLRDGGNISRGLAENVFHQLRDIPVGVEDLWVIINSLGGDLNAAYQITRRLQATARRVHIVIPRMAKSAATLITLGCHEVVMHPMAELGPIDTQAAYVLQGIIKQDSTLNAIKSIEYMREFAVDTFDKLLDLFVSRGYAPRHATRTAAHIANELVAPVFSQVNPIQMGEYYRLLDTSKEYARRLLAVSYAHLSEEKREGLLRRMAEGYPTHGFIIDVFEALKLDLNARMPDAQEMGMLDMGVAFAPDSYRLVKLFKPPRKQGAAAEPRG